MLAAQHANARHTLPSVHGHTPCTGRPDSEIDTDAPPGRPRRAGRLAAHACLGARVELHDGQRAHPRRRHHAQQFMMMSFSFVLGFVYFVAVLSNL